MNTLVIIVLSLLVIWTVLSVWIISNVVKKYNELHRATVAYQNITMDLVKRIYHMDNKLKTLDKKGTFEADDEVGFFFKELKNMQLILNEFTSNVMKIKNTGKSKEKGEDTNEKE